MIVCPKCSKENQDHYKFCLGCGGELPRGAGPAGKSFTTPTPPAGVPAMVAPRAVATPAPAAMVAAAAPQSAAARAPASVAALGAAAAPAVAPAAPAAAAPAAAVGGAPCPACGVMVPAGFKFCGSCGAKAAPAGAAAPVPMASPTAQPITSPASKGKLVLIRPDGSEGGSHPLKDGANVIGRESGSLFGGDSYLSPKHVTLTFKGTSLMVRDEASLNGVYLKIPREQPIEIRHTDIFRIGQEILLFESIEQPGAPRDGVEPVGSPIEGYWGRISLVVGRDSTANAYPIGGEGIALGRERGDLLFPEDGYVSGLHCRITTEGGRVFLSDLGSSNGTFLRLRSERAVGTGDFLLLGQQLFKVMI